MSRSLLLLLPALVLPLQAADVPGAVEVQPGVWILKGTPNESTCQALKRNRFTQVIDLRRDEEPSLDCESESSRLQEIGVQYMRYAIGKVPPAGDFDFLRTLLNQLPKGSKVLIHCSNGNRAAAVVCPWLVLDRGMPLAEALRITREAGLRAPETEAAVRRYLSTKGYA